jgi:hypothetical protein
MTNSWLWYRPQLNQRAIQHEEGRKGRKQAPQKTHTHPPRDVVHVEEQRWQAVVVQRHADDRGVVVADTVKHVRQTGDGIIS